MFPEVKMYTFNLVLSFHFNLIFLNFICCEKAVIYNMSQTVLCQQLEICCQSKRATTLWTVFVYAIVLVLLTSGCIFHVTPLAR